VSQPNPAPANPKENANRNISLAAAQELNRQSMQAVEAVTESITPWLVEFGTWIFAGLIGFAVILIAPLVTVGPIESTIVVSTVALALTLPLNLAGLLLLRLVQDMRRYEDKLAQGFHDASAILGTEFASPLAASPTQKRRTEVILLVSLGILAVSVLLTLIGLTAALWHIAWWIGILFLLMTIISLGIVIVALSVVRPPQTQEERERKQRYAEEMIRQAQVQAEETTRRAQQQAEEVTRRELEQYEKNNERAEPPH
jgi:ABC-type multidrug transport system fused ATPase/permease subunit